MTCSSFWFSVDLITDINLCECGKVISVKNDSDVTGKTPEGLQQRAQNLTIKVHGPLFHIWCLAKTTP